MTQQNTRAMTLINHPQVQRTIFEQLPQWVDPGIFTTAVTNVFLDSTIARFSDGAKMAAIAKCASLGLYPGPQDHVYLVPRKGELTVQVGYKGYAYLARQAPGVADVTVHLVHADDDIELAQDGPDRWKVVKHTRDPFHFRDWSYAKGMPLEKTGLRGAYVRKVMADGTAQTHFITGGRILKNLSCAQTDSIARKWPDRFFRKTAIRAAWADGFFHGGSDAIEHAGAVLRQHDMEAEGSDPDSVVDVTAKTETRSASAIVEAQLAAPVDPFVEAFHENAAQIADAEGCPVEKVTKAVTDWQKCERIEDIAESAQVEVMAAMTAHLLKTEPLPCF